MKRGAFAPITPVQLSGDELIRLMRRPHRKDFNKLVRRLREQGITDREIAAAMADSRQLVSPLKVRP
jgi:hypothetical protein